MTRPKTKTRRLPPKAYLVRCQCGTSLEVTYPISAATITSIALFVGEHAHVEDVSALTPRGFKAESSIRLDVFRKQVSN